jgi:hypothetical protein
MVGDLSCKAVSGINIKEKNSQRPSPMPYGKLIRFIVDCMISTLGPARKPLDHSA